MFQPCLSCYQHITLKRQSLLFVFTKYSIFVTIPKVSEVYTLFSLNFHQCWVVITVSSQQTSISVVEPLSAIRASVQGLKLHFVSALYSQQLSCLAKRRFISMLPNQIYHRYTELPFNLTDLQIEIVRHQ